MLSSEVYYGPKIRDFGLRAVNASSFGPFDFNWMIPV
jgi:hypothetical protein